MSDRWVTGPTHIPRKCHRTGTSSEEHGPYFEHNWSYFDADVHAAANGDLRHNTLYQSRAWIEHMLSQEGSPFAPIPTAEYERMKEEITHLTDQVEQLTHENVVLTAVSEEVVALTSEDIDSLVSKIVAHLPPLPNPVKTNPGPKARA